MTAVRGTNAEIVLGQGSINPADLSAIDWEEIIEGALKATTMRYLRGFKPMKDYLAERRFGQEIKIGIGCGLTSNVYLDLGVLKPLPTFTVWPVSGSENEQYAQCTETRLICSRDGDLFRVSIAWVLRKHYGDDDGTPRLTGSSLEVQGVNYGRQIDVATLIAAYPERNIGKQILGALLDAQSTTAGELLSQYQIAHKAQIFLERALMQVI